MTYNEYAATVQAFRQMAHACTRINAFLHGDTDKLLNAQRSKIQYPVLVLDFPNNVSIYQKSETKNAATVQGSFAILANAPADDFRQQNDVMLQTYEVMRMVINAALNGITIGGNTVYLFNKIEFADLLPVAKYTSDNLYGWACNFTDKRQSCPAEIWQENFTLCGELEPEGYFTWEALYTEIDDQPSNVTTCTYALGAGETFVAWYYRSINSNVWQTSTDAPLIFEGSLTTTIVLLEFTDANDCTHWQVASVPLYVGRAIYGISYPTLHTGTLELNEDIWLV